MRSPSRAQLPLLLPHAPLPGIPFGFPVPTHNGGSSTWRVLLHRVARCSSLCGQNGQLTVTSHFATMAQHWGIWSRKPCTVRLLARTFRGSQNQLSGMVHSCSGCETDCAQALWKGPHEQPRHDMSVMSLIAEFLGLAILLQSLNQPRPPAQLPQVLQLRWSCCRNMPMDPSLPCFQASPGPSCQVMTDCARFRIRHRRWVGKATRRHTVLAHSDVRSLPLTF